MASVFVKLFQPSSGGGIVGDYLKSGVVSNAGATLTLTDQDDMEVVFTPSSGGGSGYTNNLLGAGSLLTKAALFLGTPGTPVGTPGTSEYHIPYTTNSVPYYWFPVDKQWSDHEDRTNAAAVTINLIG